MSDKKDAKSADAPPAKGGLGMMGLLVLGLACATTSFASVYFLAPAPAAATSTTGTMVESVVEDAKPAKKADYTYTDVQEILITVGSAPATRFLKMQLSVASEKPDAKKVKAAETQLIDAFLL